MFFLSEKHCFHSIVALIFYYSNNSLKECFPGLNAQLVNPIENIVSMKSPEADSDCPEKLDEFSGINLAFAASI